jgi:collagenase-like PrtC family protease
MLVQTLDTEPFLAVNGTRTLSHAAMNPIGDVPLPAQAGGRALRLSPQRCDMVPVAGAFRDVLDGRSEPARAGARRERPDRSRCAARGSIGSGFSASDVPAAAAP